MPNFAGFEQFILLGAGLMLAVVLIVGGLAYAVKRWRSG